MLFGGFLNFIVPLIIIAFIAPGIANLAKDLVSSLDWRQHLLIFQQSLQELWHYFAATTLLPGFIEVLVVAKLAKQTREAATAFFELEMPPIMGVMSALLLAFVLGIGMASIGSKSMLSVFNEFNELIEKVISYVIIPLLPFHIFGIFLNMTYTGQVAKVLSVFAVVFVMIIVLHLIMLTLQYTVAGTLSKRNPFGLMKTMAPAYFTALGTQSSAATIPVTLRQARETGASEKVS